MPVVVKVQRPVFPKDAPWLVYDEQRSHCHQMHARRLPEHVRRALSGHVYKAYFWANWIPDGQGSGHWDVQDQIHKPKFW